MGKAYEKHSKKTISEYENWIFPIIEKLVKKISCDGHICWQVGNYIKDGEIIPLDYLFYDIFKSFGLKLRNRIIWHFNFGLHATRRFSGRYETLLWFTKTDDYAFHLESILVPQIYPGKRHPRSKGEKAMKPSGNPKGKNPSDFWSFSAREWFFNDPVWDIPNVKAYHPEKTSHPCQFPSELAERCILAFTRIHDFVLDPFVGAGTSLIAAAKHGRSGIGIDKDFSYIQLAIERMKLQLAGTLPTRPLGQPVRRPKAKERVATIPPEWIDAAKAQAAD